MKTTSQLLQAVYYKTNQVFVDDCHNNWSKGRLFVKKMVSYKTQVLFKYFSFLKKFQKLYKSCLDWPSLNVEEIELGDHSLDEMLTEIAKHDNIFILFDQNGLSVSEM